ncbi:hypothetical protein T484DRAFT_1785873 [Baffinella frigidus]|nr:hypothetical protein T484DRAFT_1785873 [Cryptophyta sp. CCMP2293]
MRVVWQGHSLQGHSDSITSIAFSPDGKRVVSGCHDKLIKIWNVETFAEVSIKADLV